MRRGRMRSKVTVQQQGSQTQSGSGELSDNWETYKTVWMALQPVSGRESERARQVLAEADTLADFDWSDAPAITPRMRAVYGSRTFDILHVANLQERGRRGQLQLRERNT